MWSLLDRSSEDYPSHARSRDIKKNESFEFGRYLNMGTKTYSTLILLAHVLMLMGHTTQAFAAPQTMRLDYYHTGDSSKEMFSVDRVAT